MTKGALLTTSPWGASKTTNPKYFRFILAILLLALCSIIWPIISVVFTEEHTVLRPRNADEILSRCQSLQRAAGPTKNSPTRTQSDRYESSTPSTLIRNATIWTGNHNGTEIVNGDILLHRGLIMQIGNVDLTHVDSHVQIVDANGSWVTPGIIDIHSHLGGYSSPGLDGAQDLNSFKGTAQPWLRSLDGLNTHDEAYPLSISGGVTTVLVLPGSANAIGGQAFVIKLRPTTDKTSTSMLVEPPFQINGSDAGSADYIPWRYMKHACGENPSAVYGDTRMDTIWHFRESYNEARKILRSQDEYCSQALANKWDGLGKFPEELKWEALVDVLRSRVKIMIHCYEAVDLDALVRISNEFQFPIAAFHHAHETYLVPELLKKAFGKPPGVALFATNARYKKEAYRASEFAPKILASHGLDVVMKSDHPVLDSRFLLFEAQQAHYYGLPLELALASVISTPAKLMGLDHRMGYIRDGYDADVVIWDSHPLALAATPQQVFIDGQPQLKAPDVVFKGAEFQKAPKTPDFTGAAEAAVEFDGLPPLKSNHTSSDVLFVNVKGVFLRTDMGIQESNSATSTHVLTRMGRIHCIGGASCMDQALRDPLVVDLKGGAISPGLMAYGSPLGLEEINQESSTNDGHVYDPLAGGFLSGDTTLIRAADGLLFETRDALLAYAYGGVTSGSSTPVHQGFYGGLGVAFSLGASNILETGAVIQTVTALHVSIRHGSNIPSISTQVGALRRLLLNPPSDGGNWFAKVAEGTLTLLVDAHGRDIIATLLVLKKEVERAKGSTLRMTMVGASEAHHLAKELGESGVGVIVNPPKPFPTMWEDRRLLPGPPLSKDTIISQLFKHNVTIGLGVLESCGARNLRFELGYAALQSDGVLSKTDALALASTNIEALVGVKEYSAHGDFVATVGGELMDFTSKVVAIISPGRGVVDLV